MTKQAKRAKRAGVVMAALSLSLLWLVFTITASAVPCEYEDGSGQFICTWYAQSRGNGQGDSFVKVGTLYFYL